MKIHGWRGDWPTDEYPPDGARVRYQRTQDAGPMESTVRSVWCGIEPVIELTNGVRLFPTFDPYEVVAAREPEPR